MIKFITGGPRPRPGVSRFLFHANFDRLATLSSRFGSAASEEAAAIRQEFTAILQDICVNDVWKVTFNGRLPETENAVRRFIATYQQRSGDRAAPVRILDIGASDGVTSLNLLQSIRRDCDGRAVEITVTDLCNTLLRFRKGPVTEYRSTDGHPVLVRLGRLGLRLPRSEHRWNRPATALGQWYLGQDRFRGDMTVDLRISLINPSAENDPAVRVVEMDCLEFQPSMIDGFDVVRASNIITPRYGFEGPKLHQALTNIHAYLHDGGCLVLSRNERHTEIESGSVWKKEDAGFVLVEDFGGGSEIKAEVAGFTIEIPEKRPPRVGLV